MTGGGGGGSTAAGISYCAPLGGSGSAYACSPTPALASYSAGITVALVPDVNGVGGATTLNVSGLGARPVKLPDGVANPAAANLTAGTFYFLKYDGADGTFRFSGVRAGEWRLAAAGAGREGYTSVVVERHDVQRLTVRLYPPFALAGSIEREEPCDPEGKRKLSGVYLVPDGGEGKQVMAFHEQDGTIRFPKVQPGRYTIFPVGYIPGYYVDSVKLGDREVMARPVELTNAAIPFRVIYRPNAGRVRGSVEKGSDSWVALLPQDEAQLDGQFIRAAKCDAAGRLEVGSLKPGEYYAFAFDRIDRDALTDVSFVRNLRSAALPVHVEAGKAADIELRVTPWPE